MPALTFTADSTTNQLTITGHAFNNGDGPVTPYTETGTLPTGSPAITALTDYWVKVDDANHVKLATSQANALAGTTIDITANGSGTLKLLYDLPYRRPATVTAGSQVKSRYFNSQTGDAQNRIGIFDVLIAIWNLLTGQAQSIWTTIVVAVTVTFNAAVTFAQAVTFLLDVTLASNKNLVLQGTGSVKHGTYTKIIAAGTKTNTGNGNFVTIDSSTVFGQNVHLEEYFQAGDVITAVRVRVTDNATGPTRGHARLYRIDEGNGTATTVAGFTDTTGTAGTLKTISFTGLSITIQAGKCHTLQLLPSGGTASIVFWNCEVDWTR